MTTAIALARPDELLRAGALLGATADDLGTTVGACRTSATSRWVGRPQQRYQLRLDRLADDLHATRSAFDTACDALLRYGTALAGAQRSAQEAERLVATAPHDPDLRPAVLARADYLRACAEQDEWRAASVLVDVLRDLTARAPHVGLASRASQDAAHFAHGMGLAVTGMIGLLSALGHAVPGVGSEHSRDDARDELGATAKAVLQPWLVVQDLVEALRNGKGFETAGMLTGALVLRTGKPSFERDFFGGHDGLPAPVMLALRDRDPLTDLDASALARIQHQFVTELKQLQKVRLPALGDLLADGVNLLHHEAQGGHTLLKHIGRDEDFLARRQLIDSPKGSTWVTPVSSFATLGEAQELITTALRVHAAEISAWLAQGTRSQLDIALPLAAPVGVVLDASRRLGTAHDVVVRLGRTKGGDVLVRTAMLAP